MASLRMRFPICSIRDIEQTAFMLVNTILSRKETLGAVVEYILATAVSQIEYTRSLAIVVKLMVDDLQWRNTDLHITFQDEITDLAQATYLEYWSEILGCVPKGSSESSLLDSVEPLAISAFIGDLASFGLLSFGLFEASVKFLMNRMKSRHHLRCLRMLFSRGGAYHRSELTPAFLSDCLDVVRTRCVQFFGHFTVEEHMLKELINDLIDREPHEYYPQYFDRRLDLEEVLMASVCPVKRSASPDIDEFAIAPSLSTANSHSRSWAASAASLDSVDVKEVTNPTGESILQHPVPVRPYIIG
ncbi:hypothetical protein BDZ97DRAFT_1767921 [Flammula alnicola]|nr:hypothetical protein BDZ97DRAFT_1767921 [Flammula alnicola]